MTVNEAIIARHSVRKYKNEPISQEHINALQAKIDEVNAEGDLHIQLVTNEPKAFSGTMAHYGKFTGAANYIALVGKKAPDLDEKCGYYGEKLVIFAQQLGLNTCWVALTFAKIKSAYTIDNGEKLALVISIGYGETQGVPHKSKPIQELYSINGEMPEWFKKGMDSVILAPTAINQQKFLFSYDGKKVKAKAGVGFYTKVDLGIAKYHFEIGAGSENFAWA